MTKHLFLGAALACALAAPVQAADDALYAALGGAAGIDRIVVTFVERAKADPRVAEQFRDADVERLHKMLAEQICSLSGGPCKYTGQTMQESHSEMKVTNAQFNAVAEDLQLAMEQHGVSAQAQNKLLAKLAPMQRDIVTR